MGSGNDLIGSVDLLNGSTVVATFTTLSGGGDERFMDEWWTTYYAGGAKTGAADAFHGLFGSTNETGDANEQRARGLWHFFNARTAAPATTGTLDW